MASWLVRSTPDRGVRVRTLAEETVLCSWVRQVTLTVPPPLHPGVNLAMDSGPIQGEVDIFLVASCYISQDKLRQRTGGSVG